MALHGDLRVNGELIGTYEIQRLQQLDGEDREYDYRWSVWSARHGATRTGRIRHRYSDGAGPLVAKVLMAAETVGSERT